jgi:hypothetical protein
VNLVILYPHYMYYSDIVSAPTNPNALGGGRSLTFQNGSDVANVNWVADTNNLNASERDAEYLYIAGLNLSIAKGGLVNVRLRGASDTGFTTDVIETSALDVDLNDLIGAKKDDFVFEMESTAQRRYWRARIGVGTGGSNFDFELRKVMFGKWFYFGVEPESPVRQRIEVTPRKNRTGYSIRWKGVTDAKLNFFIDRIYSQRKHNPVVLYERDWNGVLNGDTVKMCQIQSITTRNIVHGLWQVDVNFLEVI